MSIVSDLNDQQKLIYSGRILASCLYHIEKLLKPGLSCAEIEQFAATFVAKYGAKLATIGYRGYKFGTCVSINDEVVHGLPLATKLIPETGLVSVDIMVNFQGLITDAARTYVVGQVHPRMQELVASTQQATWAAIKLVKPNLRVGDLGYAMDQVAKQHGLGNVTALGGHGVGYQLHDEPLILSAGKPGRGSKIFENMVFTIEPMFTLGSGEVEFDNTPQDGWTVRTVDGTWAAHEEHTVLVTKIGCRVLTKLVLSESDINQIS